MLLAVPFMPIDRSGRLPTKPLVGAVGELLRRTGAVDLEMVRVVLVELRLGDLMARVVASDKVFAVEVHA